MTPELGTDLGQPLKALADSTMQVEANTIADAPNLKSYSDVVRSNRTGEGMSLTYVRPGKEVVISEADWNEAAKLWQYTLMGVVVFLTDHHMLRW